MIELRRELLLEDIKGDQEVAFQLLEAPHPLFLNQKLLLEGDTLLIDLVRPEVSYTWSAVCEMTTEEKIRHLINIGSIFGHLSQSIYSYGFDPSLLLFNLNALPMLVQRGLKNQVPPYEGLTEEAFLSRYQAMIVSLLDRKVDYDTLLNGKLPFYKGNLFCEEIVRAESLSAVLELLHQELQKEKTKNIETKTVVSKSTLSRLKVGGGLAGLGVLLLSLGLGYVLLSSLPKQEMISQLRLAFIQKDYSKVITTVKQADSRELSQEDKYIVALSAVMTEPLTDSQRQELSKISTQSNEDYLRYWVLIGQSQIDEAIDIASFLDDPQLLMYGMTKKIDEVQRDPDLSAEERTSQLNTYKTKLEELKKTYLLPDEEAETGTSEVPVASKE